MGAGPPTSTLVFAGFALRRLRRRWKLAVGMYLGLVAAVALAVSVTLVQGTAAEIGLQQTLQTLGDRASVQVAAYPTRNPEGLAQVENEARSEVRSTVGPLLRPGAAYLASTQLIPVSRNGKPTPDRSPGPLLASYDGLYQHVDIIKGRIPAEPRVGDAWQATMSQQGARQFGIDLGDRYCLADPSGAGFCLQLAAIWQPKDPSSTYWGPAHVPYNALTLDGPSYATVVNLAIPVSTAYVSFTPDAEAFKQFNVPEVLGRLRQLRGYFGVTHTSYVISTGLDTGLQEYWDRFTGAQFAIQLVAAQVLLVALLYIAFAAGHVLDQQREQLAIWRSRGWRRRSVWALLMLEFVILACLAVLPGLGLGVGGAAAAVRLAYGTFPVHQAVADLGVLLAPAALAFGLGLCVLGFRAAAASRGSLLEARRLTSRPALRPWWRWRQIDLGLAPIGIALLVRVPLIGETEATGGGAQGADAATLLLPGLAVLLVALAALRLLPFAARIARLLSHSLAMALASWQLARRPLQHSLLALLLLFAVALGIFASSYITTERRNSDDRIAYAVGSDIRVHYSGDVQMPPTAAVDRALRAAKGVTATSVVYRNQGQPGRASLEPWVLGVDPYTFNRVAWSRPGLNSQPLSTLVDQVRPRSELVGLGLPGEPTRLGVWVNSPGLSAQVEAVIVDSAGKPGELVLGTLDYTGWRYLDALVMVHGGAPRYPVSLKQLAIGLPAQAEPAPGRPLAKPPYPYSGTVAFSDLSVGLPGTAQPQVVARFSDTGNQSGWYATRSEGGQSLGLLKASTDVLRDGRPATLLTPDAGDGEMTIRPVPALVPLPSLASSATLDRLGVPVGGTFPLTIGSASVPVTVVAALDYFPTLYPEAKQDFLIVDRDQLLTELDFHGEPHAWPNEIWATTNGRTGQADLRLLHRSPGVDLVQDRRQLQAVARADPLGLSLEANLLVGFAAALLLAVAAFAIHFLVATTGRQSEYAILDANGLAPWTVRRSLTLEQIVVLAFSILVGAALGFVVAWIVLPSLHLDTSLAQTVPPTVVTVDPWLVAGALLAVVALAVTAGQVVSRVGRGYRLMEELRTLG